MADSNDTRTAIVEAAYAVLVEQGYDGFTTQAVADEAGVSQSLVHYYFETKRDLVLSLLDEGLTDLERQIERFAADGSPADRLLTLAEHTIETADDDELAFKRVLLELNAQAPYDDGIRDAVAYDRNYLREYVADVVREGQAGGQFREDAEAESFAATFVAAVRGAQQDAAVFDEAADDDQVVAGLNDVVTEYLIEDDG